MLFWKAVKIEKCAVQLVTFIARLHVTTFSFKKLFDRRAAYKLTSRVS